MKWWKLYKNGLSQDRTVKILVRRFDIDLSSACNKFLNFENETRLHALEKHYEYERYCENCVHYNFSGFFETPRGTRNIYEKDCKDEAECLRCNHRHWQPNYEV